MCDHQYGVSSSPERHEELASLHAAVASTMRQRDSLSNDNRFLRSQWDEAMRLLDELASRIEGVEAGDFPQFAQFASAEWVADNLGAVRMMLKIWRADTERMF